MSAQAHTPSRSSFPAVLAAVVILLLFWYLLSKVYVTQDAVEAPVPVDRPSLAEHRGEAEDLLNNYKVIDPAAGKVRLPIDRAKELVIAENAR